MSKRELIETGTDKRYVRLDEVGKFKASLDASQSLSAVARHCAGISAEPGQGGTSDRKH